ncbi:MAG: Gfo/Idh/MocA family protein, partial [Bacteroidales bacterium]
CVDVEVKGAFSPTRERLEDYTRERDIKAYKTSDELIDDVDVVHVCTPPSTHEMLTIAILEKGKHAVVEKPLTGYFGDDSEAFNGDTFNRRAGLEKTIVSLQRMIDAEKKSNGRIMYAENWVYAPAIQKEREIIQKSGAHVLRMLGEESHSGSHSSVYGIWRFSGGGSLISKGCHPLAGAVYLKSVEGRNRNGKPIRPVAVSSRTHAVTRIPGFMNKGHLRTGYKDIEDYGIMHVIFEDDTFADIIASELVLGGVVNRLEVFADNHRTICSMTPNNAMQTYTPDEKYFRDIYIVEKTETKQGWSWVSPDESWFNGYQHEMEAFYNTATYGAPLESDSTLAADVITTIYAAYVSSQGKGIEVKITHL